MLASLRRSSWHHHRLNILWLAVAVLTLCLHAAPCRAQGTSGTLPDPIGTHELNGYLDRLNVSDSQRQAAHMMHDQYKQEFRALRNGEIADFLKEMRNLQGTMMMPKREAMESIVKKMDQLTGKIATLDNRFFDQLQTILTEEQMAQMPRARMARQRARYASNQMMNMGGTMGGTVDLSEMLREVKLSAEELQTVDPQLSQYETRLTQALGKLYESATSMMMKMMDAMESLGMADQDFSDPETAEKFGQAMQQMWRDITADVMEKVAAVNELNQRTYRALVPLLAAEHARTLRNKFYTRAYPEIGFALGDDATYYESILKSDQLSDEQRAAVSAARDGLREKMDRMIDELVAMIDAHRKTFSPFDFNNEDAQKHYQKIGEYQAKAGEARNAAMEAVNAALGPDLAKTLGHAAMAAAAKNSGGVAAKIVAEQAEAMAAEAKEAEVSMVDGEVQVAHSWSGDQFVPHAITRSDLTDYATRLTLTDEQKAILTTLHAGYLEKHKQVEQGPIAALMKSVQSMWRFDQSTGVNAGPTPEIIEQVHRLRREAIAAMEKIDDEFFIDVETAVINENQAPLMKRVRLMRQRSTFNRGQEMGFAWFGGSSEARIDVSALLRQQRLNDGDQKTLDPELVKYEDSVTPAFKTRFEASMAMQKAQELWQAEMMKAREDSENNPMKFASQYQEIMGAATKAVNDANQAVVRINRSALDAVLALLSPQDATAARLAYNRKAFPNVYNDELALDSQFANAQRLEDLGAEQRRKLDDLAAEYRPAYEQWCQKMVEIASTGEPPNFMPGNDADGWRKWQERQETLANLRFDRNELSLRTITQLKGILSEDQVQRIGGLPTPKERGPYADWME